MMPMRVTRACAEGMDTITIKDLSVFYCVGVPDKERAKPQRLLLTVEMMLDFSYAAAGTGDWPGGACVGWSQEFDWHELSQSRLPARRVGLQ